MAMTYDQRRARAMTKAETERLNTVALRSRPGYYRVRSAIEPKDRYILSASDGIIRCSCKAATFAQPCHHAARLEMRLIRETHGQSGMFILNPEGDGVVYDANTVS